GASSSETVMVFNGGEPWPAPVLAVAQTGFTKSDFSAGDSCTGTMSTGETCKVQVTFAPSVKQDETAQLSFDNGKWVQPITLTGTGTVPQTPAGQFTIFVNATSGATTAPAQQVVLIVH
ncbi:MAG: hypothetical protein ACRD2D_08750, partial [Terriglobales bacterium]